MHFYQFNIGDYASHTRHLTPMEDLIYRRLLDFYYLHERPLNECSTDVARLINMRDNVDDVETVLRDFFEKVDGVGYINRRVDDEILKYRNKLETASRAGKASAERRLNDRSTTVERPFNQTRNKETKKQETVIKEKYKKENKPDDVCEKVWSDFIQHRKQKKALVTDTAIKRIRSEAEKAGISLETALTECCNRGWTGFKAEWVKKDTKEELDWDTWDFGEQQTGYQLLRGSK